MTTCNASKVIIQKPNQRDWVKDLIILGHSEKDDYIYGTESKVFMSFLISAQMTIPFNILKKCLICFSAFSNKRVNLKKSISIAKHHTFPLPFKHYHWILLIISDYSVEKSFSWAVRCSYWHYHWVETVNRDLNPDSFHLNTSQQTIAFLWGVFLCFTV